MQVAQLHLAYLVWRTADAPASLKKRARMFQEKSERPLGETGVNIEGSDFLVLIPDAQESFPEWMETFGERLPTDWAVVTERKQIADQVSLLDDNVFVVWHFYDAAEEWRTLADQGGDEDWLALVPAKYADCPIGWLSAGSFYGCCTVEDVPLPNEERWILRVGCHA